MGIKGVYGEIGSGSRVALSKLAVDQKEQHKKNLRIAIDFSIWQHQVQLGQGGHNADLRVLCFRLLRLLRLAIEPLFVFDGPHKPPFKRNKRTNVSGGSALQLAARQFLDLLGFPYISAPGEAEAECALLQREGVVDAVLSEDVDTLMFGCTTHLRSWGPEDRKSKSGSATHVDIYKANEIKSGPSGLDREGLILVALMNGGDYLPAGIPNCGIKIACEAARADFGSDLQKIKRNDSSAIRAWRDRLQHELHTNESGYFRTKHKTLEIPESFPDRAVWYYYSSPVVSTSQQVEKYRQELRWKEPDIKRLQEACQVSFAWDGIEGFRHFVRNVAPAMVGWRLANTSSHINPYHEFSTQSAVEERLVKTISGKRAHPSTGNVSELRISYIPQEVVGLTFEDVAKDNDTATQNFTATYSDDEQNMAALSAESVDDPVIATKKRSTLPYDPSAIEKQWFPEVYVKLGVPHSVQRWEAEQADPKKFATRKARARQKEKKATQPGAIEKYLKLREPGTETVHDVKPKPAVQQQKAHATNVSFSSHHSFDHNLTKAETSTANVASTSHQAISRPKSSTRKTGKTVSTITRHTRVTKPNQKSRMIEKTVGSPIADQLRSSQEYAGTTAKDINNSVNNTRSSYQGKAPIVDNHRTAKSELNKPTQFSDISTSLDSETCSIVLASIETSESATCGEAIPRATIQSVSCANTASSQNQFKARPNYNQWQDIDGDDSLLETPVSKPRNVAYVDLTLS